jgi:uncharacterized protein YmfQ (DUF2313 family)
MTCPAPPGAPTPISDALADPTGDALLPSIIAQTPRGPAWRTDEMADGHHDSFQHRFWRALADPLRDYYAKLWKVALNSTAATLIGPEDPANESLADWEHEFGLPEPCIAGVPLTVERRKLLLRMKVAAQGGQSAAYFKCLALTLGYEIEIKEFTVFRCGEGRCGYTQVGGPNNEVFWEVFIPSSEIIWFRAGGSRCGKDPLGTFGRAKDLECLLNKWKPAHTQIRFHYVYTGDPPPPFS